jgi:hypothetical protein
VKTFFSDALPTFQQGQNCIEIRFRKACGFDYHRPHLGLEGEAQAQMG